MATYESLISINGSVGDLVFYNLNGKNVVRKKSGFNKNAFKKSPTYEKVRQNSSEFGHCSKIGKIIRQCLEEFIKEANDALLYQKFAKLMTEIKDLDSISEKGKRTVENGIATRSGMQLLKNFKFGSIPSHKDSVAFTARLWDYSLGIDKSIIVDEIIIATLQIDFKGYQSRHSNKIIAVEKHLNEYIFEKQFSDEETQLHFVVLKNEDEIVQMGFV